jgi:hypothetical protein
VKVRVRAVSFLCSGGVCYKAKLHSVRLSTFTHESAKADGVTVIF